MPRVLTYDGTKYIGAYKFPDRKSLVCAYKKAQK